MVTQQSGALGGQLGSRTQLDSTFHGSDPATVAEAAICSDTPTKCQARTRLYRDGTLEAQGFKVTVRRALGGFFGTVRLQDPSGGSKAPKGSTITLTIV